MEKTTRVISFIPLFLSIALALGFALGYLYDEETVSAEEKESLTKMNEILNYVEGNYVDDVNRTDLMEMSISSMLSDLDPHSIYIPARRTEAFSESLNGHFQGVGVRFRVYEDTLMVTNVIEGGPSDNAGILPGDRIIVVDGEEITNVGLTNQDVMDLLKGPAGSIVEVTVKRGQKTKEFRISRGRIPLRSVEASYMIDDRVGYLHLTKFSATTNSEFLYAINKLKNRGMRELILDLRGNSGGYLEQAVKLADEMLRRGELIVYTQGRKRDRANFYATGSGGLENIGVSILVNEGSASASEILAGAIQDNDRGYIIGRRSFGKGLVQERKELDDKSELRLTIARYYTPCGRSIQRPYGHGIDYNEQYSDRFENGELYSIDSSFFTDSLKYYTLKKNRPVYGGGGIMPDYFVPFDSSDMNRALTQVRSVVDEFAFYYLDNERDFLLDKYPSFKSFGDNFQVSDSLLSNLLRKAADAGPRLSETQVERANWRIRAEFKETLASHLYGFVGRSYVMSMTDNTIAKAVEVISGGDIASQQTAEGKGIR